MLYAKLCKGSTQYHSIAKASRGSHGTTAPLTLCEPEQVTTLIFHSSEQGTHPTSPIISKQVVPYWTRDGTCCLGMSTPKTRPLADSSITIHIT
jgi:hypothetical protein